MQLRSYIIAISVAAVGCVLAGRVAAQPAGYMAEAFEGVDVEEQLGTHVPADLIFVNEDGKNVSLNDFFDQGRPVLLNFIYHDCPMLCSLILDGLTKSMAELAWTPGRDYDVLTVSFSPTETPDLAARQKALYLEKLGRVQAGNGWHFLTGDQESITQLADAVGFGYRWDERIQQYAHPAALVFLSPDGQVTRYLYGFEYPSANLRNALMEASEGRIGTTLDRVIFFCYMFDPSSQSYVLQAMNVMKLGGLLTMLALGLFLLIFWRREVKVPVTDSL